MTGGAETDTFVSSANNTAAKPAATTSKWKAFGEFIYNHNEGTVLGRTGKSWLQIFIFYLIFYGVLAAFFAVLIVLFLQTLDPREPKWQKESSLIGNVPGMGFRPSPPEQGSTLVWVKPPTQGIDKNVQTYLDNLNTTLFNYEPGQQTGNNYIDCTKGTPPTLEEMRDGKVCKFNLGELGSCTKENQWGYATGQPCVLIKLNRIFGWIPEPFPEQQVPLELTAALKEDKKTYDKNTIYVTCQGEENMDKEHIGPIKIYPERHGFGTEYYPYKNVPGYLSPIVMVQFLNPSPGVIVNVECKAWANNIAHNRVDRLGQVHFEIKVDR